jgi:hypothetical protein
MNLSSISKKVLQKFVKLYFSELERTYYDGTLIQWFQNDEIPLFRDLESLRILVEKQNYSKIGTLRFTSYLSQTFEDFERKQLRDKLIASKIRTLDKAIQFILEIYGNNWIERINLLYEVLSVRFYVASRASLEKKIRGMTQI